jgi:S-adenosyl methyltransferase
VAEECPPPAGIDATRPHAARVYDFVLGGRDNCDADREYAAKVLKAAPEYPRPARANRAFLVRAVRALAEVGVWRADEEAPPARLVVAGGGRAETVTGRRASRGSHARGRPCRRARSTTGRENP